MNAQHMHAHFGLNTKNYQVTPDIKHNKRASKFRAVYARHLTGQLHAPIFRWTVGIHPHRPLIEEVFIFSVVCYLRPVVLCGRSGRFFVGHPVVLLPELLKVHLVARRARVGTGDHLSCVTAWVSSTYDGRASTTTTAPKTQQQQR